MTLPVLLHIFLQGKAFKGVLGLAWVQGWGLGVNLRLGSPLAGRVGFGFG